MKFILESIKYPSKELSAHYPEVAKYEIEEVEHKGKSFMVVTLSSIEEFVALSKDIGIPIMTNTDYYDGPQGLTFSLDIYDSWIE